MKGRPNRKQAIADPLSDAKERYHQTFTIAKAAGDWEPYGAYYTTNEFGALDEGYVRHCGPTAIVNLLMTLMSRFPSETGKRPVPARFFKRVAGIGKKKRFYINADFLKFYGGTLNIAAPAYIKAAARAYGRDDLTLKAAKPAWTFFLKRAIDHGALLYLELVLHPLYGNHHVLVYGYRELISDDGKTKKLYLLTADGWTGEKRYLCADSLRLSRFLEIDSVKKLSSEKTVEKK